MNDDRKELLSGVQAQIASFDNKASILISVVGIIFALALSFLDVFHMDFFMAQSACFKTWYHILFFTFITTTVFSLLSFAMVILPRKHKAKTKYPNYYNDIVKMSSEELKIAITKYTEEDAMIIEQLKINSEICNKKHRWLFSGILLMIPFVLLIIVLTIITTFA